jgi:hypothetical protein
VRACIRAVRDEVHDREIRGIGSVCTESLTQR